MNARRIECFLRNEADTRALAYRLARNQPGPAMVHLQGDLGSGKSTLARAWLRALGVVGLIPSPTYSLVERYQTTVGEVLHLDLYRIADTAELEFLGIDEGNPRLWLVEWPERASTRLPMADLHIQLELAGTGRLILMTAKSPLGCTWLKSAII